MMRSVWSVLSTLAATCLALACGDPVGPGDRGDADAPVELWPLPRSGRTDVRVPFALAGASAAGRGGRAGEGVSGTSANGGAGAGGNGDGDVDAGTLPVGDPTLDQLDPDEVYIFGTLSEGACYLDAIAPVLAPDRALVGFDCSASLGVAYIRPDDGRMIYAQFGGRDAVYGFRCDGCSYVTGPADYPDAPLANDEPMPTPACDASAFMGQFTVTAEGELAYRCQDGQWYDADGEALAGLRVDPASLLSIGHEHTALLTDGVVDLETGELAPWEGLTQPRVIAVRAVPDGYWIAVQPEDAMQPPELWEVAFDGTAMSLGVYPDPPADQEVLSQRRLDGEGRLVQFARDTTEVFRDTIIRRSIEGESAVIYDEADDPVVKLHISNLFTGP